MSWLLSYNNTPTGWHLPVTRAPKYVALHFITFLSAETIPHRYLKLFQVLNIFSRMLGEQINLQDEDNIFLQDRRQICFLTSMIKIAGRFASSPPTLGAFLKLRCLSCDTDPLCPQHPPGPTPHRPPRGSGTRGNWGKHEEYGAYYPMSNIFCLWLRSLVSSVSIYETVAVWTVSLQVW